MSQGKRCISGSYSYHQMPILVGECKQEGSRTQTPTPNEYVLFKGTAVGPLFVGPQTPAHAFSQCLLSAADKK